MIAAGAAYYFFLFEWHVNNVAKSYLARINESETVNVAYGNLKREGFSNIILEDLTVELTKGPAYKGRINRATVGVDVWAAIFGGPRFRSVAFDSILFCQAEAVQEEVTEMSADKIAEKLQARLIRPVRKICDALAKINRRFPASIKARSAAFGQCGEVPAWRADNFVYEDEQISAVFANKDARIKMEGRFSQRPLAANIFLSVSGNVEKAFAPLKQRAGISVSARTLRIAVNSFEDGDEARLDGSFEAAGARFFHKRLSKDTLLFRRAKIDFALRSSNDALEVDSSSIFSINGFEYGFGLRAEVEKNDYVASASLNISAPTAQKWIDALPSGAFDLVRTMKASGGFDYQLKVGVDSRKAKPVAIISEVKPKKLRLNSSGAANLRKLNSSFTYRPFWNNREFLAGPENPNFAPYDRIPERMIYSVLYAEDGGFFWHRGFYPDAFEEALQENLEKKRFRRGASTISMQLVKNVFLTPHKTLARKAEEIILVWLLERYRLASKKRMLEVYLNIIEWGPNIYGIGPAARFYFNKRPGQLTVDECIYLAAIIPRPRAFKYQFNKETGALRKHHQSFFRIIGKKLLKKSVITQAEFEKIDPENVVLTGRARNYLSDAAKAQVKAKEIDLFMDRLKQAAEPDTLEPPSIHP